MGRPRDQFAWKQVEVLGDNNTWRCKYCSKEYTGAASRIRNHLSGQGNGIVACPTAPEPIQNEASKKVIQKKRVRLIDSPPSSPSNDPEIIAKRAIEQHVTDAFLKFLLCNNVQSVAYDAVKDPSCMEFLERASKHGIPSSLLAGDSLFIKKSVFNIELEVEQYTQYVKNSWKTMGCTMMLFNLQSNKDMKVIAFYCPKGIFFIEARYLNDHYTDVLQLQEHVHWLFHSRYVFNGEEGEYLDEDHLCELTDRMTTKTTDEDFPWEYCVQNEIQRYCITICSQSEWAQSLFNIAVQIHEILCSSDEIQSWYYKILRRKRLSFKVLANNYATNASRLSVFLSINSIEGELMRPQPKKSEIVKALADIEAITNGSLFWIEGSKLAKILECVTKIGDVMDTFVPSAGYLGMALEKVDSTIQFYELNPREEAFKFWKELKSKFVSRIGHSRLAASYLNPVYYLQQLQKDSELPPEKLKNALLDILDHDDEELSEEVERYAVVFRNVPEDYKLEDHHPVKVWESHGHSLPILQRFAIIALSRPLSCMCKQVKKHLYQVERAEDYILILNVRMMQHFKLLGDDICKPLDLSDLD